MFGVINTFRFTVMKGILKKTNKIKFKILQKMEIYDFSFKAFKASAAVLTTNISFIDAE